MRRGCKPWHKGIWVCGHRELSYLLNTIKALCSTVLQVQLCFTTRSVNCCQYSDSLHLPIMTGSRLSILSVGQVAPYLRGITAAIKSAWANRKALVCLWGVNGERHWRQEVLRKWKALYCTPEWPGIGFPSNPMGKPHYRSLHRVITTGQWSSSDPLHLNDNITSLYSFFPLVWPDDDPCGIGMLSVEWCVEVTVEHVQDLAHASVHKNPLQHTCGPHPLSLNVSQDRWGDVVFLYQQVPGPISHSTLQRDIIRPLKLNCNIDPSQADLP